MDVASRQADRRIVLLTLYSMGQGDVERDISREELVEESGLSPKSVADQVQWLIRGGFLHATAGDRTLNLTSKGISQSEETLRKEYYSDKEGDLDDEDKSAPFALMCDLEWERHHVLLQMYDYANRYTAGYMHLDQFAPPATRRALAFLRDTEFAETRGITSRLSATGRDLIENRLLRINPRGTFGRDELLALLEAVWAPSVAIPSREFVHSPDYKSVSLDGQSFALPDRAAETVRLLHRQWRAGTPDVTIQTIRELFRYSENTRMRDIFGKRHVNAMDALITKSGQGCYRLNI